MATIARNPRDLVLESNAAYQRLAEQHQQYEAELHKISTSQFLSSEDLLEEIRLKKLKLHVKDEMIQLAARLQRDQAPHSE
ncbi:MAG TPA: YdcH family protein [Candidatus Acidoferrum sp.]|nr:YdcH family protein [Candidatus Acidoferrum sp.]